MSKENHSHVDETIADIERLGKKPHRRIGTREKDLHSEYVNEAYAGGYLTDEEVGVRRDKILTAKYARDLGELVDDLPSYAELKGRKNVPVRVQKRGFWLTNFFNKSPVLSAAITLVLGLLIAIVPGVTFVSMFPGRNVPFPFSGFMAGTITLGICITLFAIVRFIYLVADDDSVLYKKYSG
jgi:hypothetical protein